jgi:hypothetical protein
MTAGAHTQSIHARARLKTQSAALLNLLPSPVQHRHRGHPKARQQGTTLQPAMPHHPAHHKEKLPPGIQYQPF